MSGVELPEAIDWVGALTDISLIGWLILSILALLLGWVVTKKAHESAVENATRELRERLEYVEARRKEEREGRIAAERRITELTERWDRALAIMGNIERELIRGLAPRGRDE